MLPLSMMLSAGTRSKIQNVPLFADALWKEERAEWHGGSDKPVALVAYHGFATKFLQTQVSQTESVALRRTRSHRVFLLVITMTKRIRDEAFLARNLFNGFVPLGLLKIRLMNVHCLVRNFWDRKARPDEPSARYSLSKPCFGTAGVPISKSASILTATRASDRGQARSTQRSRKQSV